jgi:hypothetical protein
MRDPQGLWKRCGVAKNKNNRMVVKDNMITFIPEEGKPLPNRIVGIAKNTMALRTLLSRLPRTMLKVWAALSYGSSIRVL